jgi:hypothetical protein
MMTKGTMNQTGLGEAAELLIAIADAGAAADRAAEIAAATSLWSMQTPGAEGEAAEVASAAMRARLAAERADNATTANEAWSLARLAWAAEQSAEEASARVNAMVAEELMSVEPGSTARAAHAL